MSVPPIRGLVLAGGRSRRLGLDKAALQVAGRCLLDLAVERLEPMCEDVRVSVATAPSQGDPRFRHRWIADATPGAGPMAGLVAAQRHDAAVAWLVLAVDMPGLRDVTLQRLVAGRIPSRPATALRTREGPEPLVAIYEPASAAGLAAAFRSGERSLRRWLTETDPAWVDARQPETASINTPAAWAAYCDEGH